MSYFFINFILKGKPLTKTEIEEFNLRCMVDGPKETREKELIDRLNAMKKRLKKIKTRVLESGCEYEVGKQQSSTQDVSNGTPKSKIPKLLKELEKISKSNDRYNPNVDRTCGELNRILLKNSIEQTVFFTNNGLTICIRLLEQINNINLNGGSTSQVASSAVSNEIIANSTKTTNNLILVIINASQSYANAYFELTLTNKLLSLVEILNLHSKIMHSAVSVHEAAMAAASCSTKTNGNNSQRISNEWLICSNLFSLLGSIYSFVCERAGKSSSSLSTKSLVIDDTDKEKDLNQRVFDFIW